MWKWLTWAARIAATALLLSFLSIWTTGYIVNSYMETLLKQLNLPLETQPFALSGVWGKLWGASPAPGGQAGESKDEDGMPNLPGRGGQPGASGANEPPAGRSGWGSAESPVDGQSGKDDAGSQVDGQNAPHAESPAGGQGVPGSGESPSGGGGASSDGAGDRADEPEGTPSPADGDSEGSAAGGPDGAVPVFGGQGDAPVMSDEQRQAVNAIMSKLNGEQLSALSGYLEDGLTPDELTAVQELIKPSLTDTEYARILEALAPGRPKADESTGTSSDRE